MKKLLLIMMAFMASFGAYAQEVNTENEENVAVYSVTKLTSVTVDLSEISYPYTISTMAPSGDILGISGPTYPNIQTWNVSGGVLTITLNKRDFDDLYPGMIGRIEVATTNGGYYIELVCE